MRMTKDTYEKLSDAIPYMPPGATERERWDYLWGAIDSGRIAFHEVFDGLNDDHVDTALRKLSRRS